MNYQKVKFFILYKNKFSLTTQNKAFKLKFEMVLKKSLKKTQNKPYIVTHWYATLNIKLARISIHIRQLFI